MVLCTALILLVSSSYCNEQPTIPGQVPTRAECGEVNFAEAVEFGRKFLRESFQASRAPFKETWLDLDKPAYEVLSQKQLMIRFSGARLIFWRETGKFAGGGLSVLAPGTGDIGVADASGLAEKYFRLIEPHSDCKVELQGRSGENYQFKVVKVLSKIPFSEGFTCWIDPHYGRLASSLYVPSPPVHPSSIVRTRIGEATNAASAAIARFAQSEWIFVHSDKTALEYWYPPADAIVQEMTDEQKAIARQRFAIPIYTIYATNVIVKGGREGHSLRYFISVDARNGKAMAISVLDVGEKFSLNALHDSKAVVDIWDGKSIRVLSDSEWISNRDARLMKATQRTHSASGRKVTIAIDDAIFPALYDPKAKLLWDASDRKAWVGAANKELADLLSNAKPAKIGFGAPK